MLHRSQERIVPRKLHLFFDLLNLLMLNLACHIRFQQLSNFVLLSIITDFIKLILTYQIKRNGKTKHTKYKNHYEIPYVHKDFDYDVYKWSYFVDQLCVINKFQHDNNRKDRFHNSQIF